MNPTPFFSADHFEMPDVPLLRVQNFSVGVIQHLTDAMKPVAAYFPRAEARAIVYCRIELVLQPNQGANLAPASSLSLRQPSPEATRPSVALLHSTGA